MMSDTELREQGIRVLARHLGDIEMERFVTLMQRESFDYTQWRQNIDDGEDIAKISNKAMAFRNQQAFSGVSIRHSATAAMLRAE